MVSWRRDVEGATKTEPSRTARTLRENHAMMDKSQVTEIGNREIPIHQNILFAYCTINDVLICKNVPRIDPRFDSLDHGHTRGRERLLHPLLAELSNAVVMRQRPTIGQNLVSGLFFNLQIGGNRVLETSVVESKVKVDGTARLVALRDAGRAKGRMNDALLLAGLTQLLLHIPNELLNICPRNARLK